MWRPWSAAGGEGSQQSWTSLRQCFPFTAAVLCHRCWWWSNANPPETNTGEMHDALVGKCSPLKRKRDSYFLKNYSMSLWNRGICSCVVLLHAVDWLSLRMLQSCWEIGSRMFHCLHCVATVLLQWGLGLSVFAQLTKWCQLWGWEPALCIFMAVLAPLGRVVMKHRWKSAGDSSVSPLPERLVHV